jgi:hypothetical protein
MYLERVELGIALLQKPCHSIHRCTANFCEEDKASAFVVLPCGTPYAGFGLRSLMLIILGPRCHFHKWRERDNVNKWSEIQLLWDKGVSKPAWSHIVGTKISLPHYLRDRQQRNMFRIGSGGQTTTPLAHILQSDTFILTLILILLLGVPLASPPYGSSTPLISLNFLASHHSEASL